MTQAELELIARGMRARGLHSSWDNLLEFSKDIASNLADAYQALLRNAALSDTSSLSDPNNAQKIVRDKLAKALTLLTSKAQVARWEAEAAAENRKHETLGFEGSTHKCNQEQ